MSMKEIVNESTHKQMQQECTLYTNKNEIAVEFSKSRELEHFTSTTFVILIVLEYKRARQSRLQSVRVQSALCEVACEQNSRVLKIAVVKI